MSGTVSISGSWNKVSFAEGLRGRGRSSEELRRGVRISVGVVGPSDFLEEGLLPAAVPLSSIKIAFSYSSIASSIMG